jgi:hypothetical protein
VVSLRAVIGMHARSEPAPVLLGRQRERQALDNGAKVLSFVPLQSQVTTAFAAAHHCSFWATG